VRGHRRTQMRHTMLMISQWNCNWCMYAREESRVAVVPMMAISSYHELPSNSKDIIDKNMNIYKTKSIWIDLSMNIFSSVILNIVNFIFLSI
jgi:hypothetical protein